jgi:predicted metal-binding membrane protein
MTSTDRSLTVGSAPAVAAIATVAIAAIAWVAVIWQTSTAGEMGMGPKSPGSFAVSWVAMMAAMMLPSATPFVMAFVRELDGSRSWLVGVCVVLAVYLFVWACFGFGLFAIANAVGVPSPGDLSAGVAIALAGLYALTPLKRAGQARCLEMCRRLTLPAGSAVRAAGVAGSAYGLSCVACSAGVMVVLFAVGMSDIRLMVLAAALVLLFKLATPWARRIELVVTVALVLAGGWYLLGQPSPQVDRAV